MSARRASDWLGLYALIGMWGTAFLFTRIAVESVPPLTLVTGRVAIAALVLCLGARLIGVALPREPGLWARYGLLALVGNALPFFLISWGQERVASGLAGILMAVMPLATLLLAHFFVENERLTPLRVVGFAIGFGGVVVLIGPELLLELGGDGSTLARQLAVLGGALCYGVNTILARRMPPAHPASSAAATMCMATLWTLPLALALDRPWTLEPGLASLLAVGWLGLVSTAAATVVYFQVIASAGPTFLSLINYQIPVLALLVGVVFAGERFGPSAFAALGLILGGLAVSERVGRARRAPARATH